MPVRTPVKVHGMKRSDGSDEESSSDTPNDEDLKGGFEEDEDSSGNLEEEEAEGKASGGPKEVATKKGSKGASGSRKAVKGERRASGPDQKVTFTSSGWKSEAEEDPDEQYEPSAFYLGGLNRSDYLYGDKWQKTRTAKLKYDIAKRGVRSVYTWLLAIVQACLIPQIRWRPCSNASTIAGASGALTAVATMIMIPMDLIRSHTHRGCAPKGWSALQ